MAEGSGGGFDAGGEAVFGVAGGDAAPLAENFEVVHGHGVAGEVEQTVEEHGGVAVGEDEAVAVGPGGVGGVEFEVVLEEGVGHRRAAHWSAGVARVGFLDRIHREGAEGVDGQCGQGRRWGRHGEALRVGFLLVERGCEALSGGA